MGGAKGLGTLDMIWGFGFRGQNCDLEAGV